MKIKSKKHYFRHVSIAVAAFVLLASSVYTIRQNPSADAVNCGNVGAPLSSYITTSVNENKNFYIAASNATGVPWEMLAAIHYRETSFSHTNPGNGQGIFQFVNGAGGPYPPGPVSDAEFQRQLNFMASKIQSDYVYRGSLNYNKRPLTKNETEIYRIKDTLFSYNGRSSQYAQQATQYGFSATTEPYEGSPYVMNLFDCQRSGMGIITKDYGSIDGIDTRYGAFTLYARLKGDAYWASLVASNLPGCNEATNTVLSCVWRLTNLATGDQALTTSLAERNLLVSKGWQFQMNAFFGINNVAPQPGNVPVYRLENNAGASFLTIDANERNFLIAIGYKDKGIDFYADPIGANSGYPVYRLYSSSKDRHIWTPNVAEVNSLLNQGYVSEGIAFMSVSKYRRETAPPAGQQLVYRFGDMPGNSHFWTTSLAERDEMIRVGYHYEGVAWNASTSTTTVPIYRLYSAPMKKHLYTKDLNEKNVLSATSTWAYEGIAYYTSSTPTAKPIYRLYSPITTNHLLTKDLNERNVLIQVGTFRDEGIAWYAY